MTHTLDFVTRFLNAKREAITHLDALLEQVGTAPAKEANDAVEVLCTILSGLTQTQLTLVSEKVRELSERFKRGDSKRMIQIIRHLPQELPDKALLNTFVALEMIATKEKTSQTCSNALKLIRARSRFCPKEQTQSVSETLDQVIRKRTLSAETQICAVSALESLIFYSIQLHRNDEDTGMISILRACTHQRKEVRKRASRAFASLGELLPHVLSERLYESINSLLSCDENSLGKSQLARAKEVKREIVRGVCAAPRGCEALGLVTLEALLTEGPFITHFSETRRLFNPCWSNVGHRISRAVSIDRAWPTLKKGLTTMDDFTPMYCANVIASYGPEARGKLRELVSLFKQNHHDCCVSSPLLWAILQVGIGTKIPNQVLNWIEKKGNQTCPHTVDLVYLVRNRKPKPDPRWMRYLKKST